LGLVKNRFKGFFRIGGRFDVENESGHGEILGQVETVCRP
jgi:hypothetical protein